MARWLLPTVAVLAVSVLAAGCGKSSSSETNSTTTWASGVCSALTTWKDSIASVGDSLKAGNVSTDALKSAADDAKSATETLASDLKGLGKPDIEAGQKAKDSVDQLSSELKSDADKIESAVDGVSGVSGVLSAVSVVSATLVTMGSQISSTFTALEQLDAKGELQDAFKQASACKQLTNSGS